MGLHLSRLGRLWRRRDRLRDSRRYDGYDRRYDADEPYDDRGRPRGPRIPGTVLLGGIVLWSLLALGLWVLVDPLLAWAAGMVGPATDLGVGFAGWFGLGREAAALRDISNVEELGGCAIGPLHFLAKAGLILVWLAGAAALVSAPRLLRRF